MLPAPALRDSEEAASLLLDIGLIRSKRSVNQRMIELPPIRTVLAAFLEKNPSNANYQACRLEGRRDTDLDSFERRGEVGCRGFPALFEMMDACRMGPMDRVMVEAIRKNVVLASTCVHTSSIASY